MCDARHPHPPPMESHSNIPLQVPLSAGNFVVGADGSINDEPVAPQRARAREG